MKGTTKPASARLERSMPPAPTLSCAPWKGHVAALKDEYARMVQQAYRMKLGENPLLFVFAAEDFNQAALRFRLLGPTPKSASSRSPRKSSRPRPRNSAKSASTWLRNVMAVQKCPEPSKPEADACARTALDARQPRVRTACRRVSPRTAQGQGAERQRLSDEIKRLYRGGAGETERASAAGEFTLTPAASYRSHSRKEPAQPAPGR